LNELAFESTHVLKSTPKFAHAQAPSQTIPKGYYY